MPTPEARAAFEIVQSLSTALHDLANREQRLVERIRVAVTAKQLDEPEAQVVALCNVWGDLVGEYTAAIKDYGALVRKTLPVA